MAVYPINHNAIPGLQTCGTVVVLLHAVNFSSTDSIIVYKTHTCVCSIVQDVVVVDKILYSQTNPDHENEGSQKILSRHCFTIYL